MGRIHDDGVGRAREAAAERLVAGMPSPYVGAALSPAGREAVLDALRDAWTRAPALRLCQLIWNASLRDDPYYVEDGELLAALRAYGREAA